MSRSMSGVRLFIFLPAPVTMFIIWQSCFLALPLKAGENGQSFSQPYLEESYRPEFSLDTSEDNQKNAKKNHMSALIAAAERKRWRDDDVKAAAYEEALFELWSERNEQQYGAAWKTALKLSICAISLIEERPGGEASVLEGGRYLIGIAKMSRQSICLVERLKHCQKRLEDDRHKAKKNKDDLSSSFSLSTDSLAALKKAIVPPVDSSLNNMIVDAARGKLNCQFPPGRDAKTGFLAKVFGVYKLICQSPLGRRGLYFLRGLPSEEGVDPKNGFVLRRDAEELTRWRGLPPDFRALYASLKVYQFKP